MYTDSLSNRIEFAKDWTPLLCDCLGKTLVKDEYDHSDHDLSGFCYIASEAIYHFLTNGRSIHTSDINVYCGKYGDTHWWLKYDGDKIDVTAPQYGHTRLQKYYENAMKAGFLTKECSKRATVLLKLLNQVWELHFEKKIAESKIRTIKKAL